MHPEWMMYAVARTIIEERYRDAERYRIASGARGGRRRLAWRRPPQRRPGNIPAPRPSEPAEPPVRRAA